MQFGPSSRARGRNQRRGTLLGLSCLLVGLLVLSPAALAQQHGTGHHAQPPAPRMPQEAGQSAFAAIQEIVLLLNEDPSTDWERVDLEALRQHLRDMDEVTLRADAVTEPIRGGVVVAVTGTGRTQEAIRRMVPAHAVELDKVEGWEAAGQVVADGAKLTVTSTDPEETRRIRGLGFIGLMAMGAHHQAHHLAIARGEPVHAHR